MVFCDPLRGVWGSRGRVARPTLTPQEVTKNDIPYLVLEGTMMLVLEGVMLNSVCYRSDARSESPELSPLFVVACLLAVAGDLCCWCCFTVLNSCVAVCCMLFCLRSSNHVEGCAN